ncbi:MAG TPA: cyclase family protein [Cyclobacteriaceae bacterium]|nr:cyclase family protein [Cyclobacteriaceae bacterium]
MIIQLTFNSRTYSANLARPHDISLPLKAGDNNPNCYWAEPVKMETIRSGDFVGSVQEGGSVNYQKLFITPHGNGTHTECYGHISADGATLNQCLTKFHFIAEVVSVTPEQIVSGDFIITRKTLAEKIKHAAQAIVIRTLPNADTKRAARYSGTNPPYLAHEAAAHLVELGVRHLLIDLPSVDRESDGGQLLTHKAFWQFPGQTRKTCTITELVYVPDTTPDGIYLLNLQITSLEMDASPSKPVLYNLAEVS